MGGELLVEDLFNDGESTSILGRKTAEGREYPDTTDDPP